MAVKACYGTFGRVSSWLQAIARSRAVAALAKVVWSRNLGSRRGMRCGNVAALSLIAALWAPNVHAWTQDIAGTLEVNDHYSAIWYIGEESGDLVGYVFHNLTPQGHIILQNCLPRMRCVVEDAEVVDMDADALMTIPIDSNGASAMFEIQDVSLVYMDSVYAFEEVRVNTRFGLLEVDDEQQLLFNGEPVMAPAHILSFDDELQQTQEDRDAPSLWQRFTQRVRSNFRSILGQSESDSDDSADLEPVQGDMSLMIVDGYQTASSDIIVVRNSGRGACPALFRVVTLSEAGVVSTPEFGTCSDVVRVFTLGTDEPGLEFLMTEYRGPSVPIQERLQAAMKLRRFEFFNGQVRAVQ